MNPELSDRYYASIPADDPRFTELRALLAQVRQHGRHSPASRMLGEWALLGFLLTTGHIAIATQNNETTHRLRVTNADEIAAAQKQIEVAASGFGGFEG